MMKINVGCGTNWKPGYINCDINSTLNPQYSCSADNLYFCGDGQADEIVMDAVYEHLYVTERPRALREWHRCLRQGGRLVINWIPDMDAAAVRFALHVMGDCGPNCGPRPELPHFDLEVLERFACAPPATHKELAYNVHKGLFTRKIVVEELEAAGFKIISVEWKVYPGELGTPLNFCVEAERI